MKRLKYTLVAILVALSLTYIGAWCFGSDAKISFELAIASMRKEKPKVPQSQCTTCGGTGRVKSGDTIVVTDSACPDCYPDPSGPIDGDPADNPVKITLVIHSIPGCPPCIQQRRAKDALIAQDKGFSENDFKIVNKGARVYPTIEVRLNGEEVQRVEGYHSATRLATLRNHWFAIAQADLNYKDWGPEQWKWFCEQVDLEAYVKGMTYPFHITEHHGKYALRPEQIEGLRQSELIEIHGWQHTHKDID